MKKLILFLVRRKLGLKNYEAFRFANQKTNAIYYFTPVEIVKEYGKFIESSGVSLNWLLDDRCEIVRVNNESKPNIS